MKNQNFQSPWFSDFGKRVFSAAYSGEICLICTCSGTGIDRRIIDWQTDKRLLLSVFGEDTPLFTYFDFNSDRDISFLETYVSKNQSSNQICIVNSLDSLLLMDLRKVFSIIERIKRRGNIKFIFLMKGNYYDQKYKSIWGDAGYYFTRVFVFPFLDNQQSDEFITYLCVKWNISLSRDLYDRIKQLSGGWMAVLKHLVWMQTNQLPMGPLSDQASHHSLMWLFSALWEKFSTSEKDILYRIVYTKYIDNDLNTQISLDYLCQLGLVRQLSQGYEIASSGLIEFIRAEVKQRNHEVTSSEETQNSHSGLTKKQQNILNLIQSKSGQIVSKSELSEKIWPNDEITDWAIDGQISRLRKRLEKLNSTIGMLKTVKGRGYIWQE